MGMRTSSALILALMSLQACGTAPHAASNLHAADASAAGPQRLPAKFADVADQVLAELPDGEDQRQVLCAKPGANAVQALFCAKDAPKIADLKDLQQKLGVAPNAGNSGFFGQILGGVFGSGTNFVFTGASSSLVGRFTSAINPRLVAFTGTSGNDPNMVALGFVRGEQFAELVARDSDSGQLRFFLLRFRQDCNDRTDGCSNGELLGPAIESKWTKVTVYEDEQIKNTILDCKQCHQPQGPSTNKMLRMQELTRPWTHFFSNSTTGGQALLADFQQAHAGEDFAGIPADRISNSDPQQLENFVRNHGFGDQPNEFPSPQVEGSGAFGGFINFGSSDSSRLAAWQPLYDRFVQGTAIAPPYHEVKVTDPTKLAAASAAYRDLASGKLSPAAFPDTRDVLQDSGLRDMGYMVKDGLSGDQILVQACSQCHNSRLDQSISRARFNVDLSKMSAKEKNRAIARMNLPDDDALKMPPVRFRTLTPAEIERATAVLVR